MSSLVFQSGGSEKLRDELLASDLETAAIILARPVETKKNKWRLLVQEIISVPQEGYLDRSRSSITLKPEFLVPILKKARLARFSVILTHTHPWEGEVHASQIDRDGERVMMPTLFRRIPGVPHGRLIFGLNGYDAMLRSENDENEGSLGLIDVSANIRHPSRTPQEFQKDQVFDRQIRAFGSAGQQKIESFRVAIVGLGGTGSVVTEQLAHLGVRDFLLIDPELLEETNLNRVVGAKRSSIGKSKVEVARDLIISICPSAQVTLVKDSVLLHSVARRILEADLFFCCTDSHGSRAVLTQLSYQYLIPGFDLGVRIESDGSRITHITGRVQMLAPGLACLICSGLLDSEAVRRDLMTESERRADPYIVGGDELQPAVISINSVVASLATTMYLAAVVGFPISARHQIFRAEKGVVHSVLNEPVRECVVCSANGALGKGDAWSLPGRLR